MNVLVDTSAWSLAFRRRTADLNSAEGKTVAELADLVRAGGAKIIGPIRQELLGGIKTQAQFERLRDLLRAFVDEPIATSDYEEAAGASNACRSKGIVVSAVDILICSIALRRGWPILTTDSDFRNYAKVLPVRLHMPRP